VVVGRNALIGNSVSWLIGFVGYIVSPEVMAVV